MSAHEKPAPVQVKFLTPGTIFLILSMAAGAGLAVWRYITGIDAPITNQSNIFPWGIWKAVNVAAIAAIGSSGFTMTAAIHVFNKQKYHNIMRPSLVVAMFCYTFVGIALLVDLGRYYFIWHVFLPVMWQVNSALFEVAMCVVCYLTVLYLEFAPILFERFIGRVNLPGPLKSFNKLTEFFLNVGSTIVGKTISVFMVLGILFCCLHQSTLGTLMVIPAYKLHPLWWTKALPPLFLLSAVAVGLCSAVAISLWSSYAFKTKYEMKALSSLARSLPVAIGVYLGVRLIDLALRDQLGTMWEGTTRSHVFLLEFFVGMVLPWFMLLFSAVRKSPKLLFFTSSLFVLAIAFNRVNTYITAYMPPYVTGHYFPSITEIVICFAQIAALIFLYRVVVVIFPVISQPEKHPA
jgi:Ni/Fe-hydrogenase subunit HybB-like protein